MKPAQQNPIMASRHTLGAASFASGAGRPVQPFRVMPLLRRATARAVDGVMAALDFYVREILPHALPSDALKSENGALCSAHWNRIYLLRGGKY
jgi:hypothetical protein